MTLIGLRSVEKRSRRTDHTSRPGYEGECGGEGDVRLAERQHHDVEVAVGGDQLAHEGLVDAGVGGVEGDGVDLDARPLELADRASRRDAARRAPRRVSSATAGRSTIARPMSLVPPRSTIVCGSPRALSMGQLPDQLVRSVDVQASARRSRRRARSLAHTPGRVDRRPHGPPLVEARVARGGSPPAWCGRPWPGSGARRRRARGRRACGTGRAARAWPSARRASASSPARGS